MGRYLGNPAAHAAMNRHMVLMMGHAGERRMHIALGYRYSGCPGSHSFAWVGPMGGMMGGYYGRDGARGRGGYGPGMMRGFRYRGGGSMMGRFGSSHGDSDIGALGVALIALGAAALGGLLVALALRLRRPGAAPG